MSPSQRPDQLQQGSSAPPFQGMRFTASGLTLGTCTGIWISTASVGTWRFVAETGNFARCSVVGASDLVLALVPVGVYITPIGEVHY